MLYRYLIKKLPYRRLETAVYEATLAIFGGIFNHIPEQHLYSFAYCTDCDVQSLFWTANSEEALETQVKEWLGRTRQSFPDSSATLIEALQLLRFEPPDWQFHEEWLRRVEASRSESLQKFQACNEALAKIWDIFDRIPMSEDRRFSISNDVRRSCLEAIVAGLRRADQKLDWSRIGDRNKVLLLVYVIDSDEPEEVREMARRLNPASIFEAFSAQFQMSVGSDNE